MAERYGGEFSPEPPNKKPDGNVSWRGKVRTKAGARTNFLFLAPLPLAIRAFFQEPTGLALTLLGLGLLLPVTSGSSSLCHAEKSPSSSRTS